MYKAYLLIFLTFLAGKGWAQHPFDYGQNEQVYFISAKVADSIGVNEIYTISQSSETNNTWMEEDWYVKYHFISPDYFSSDHYVVVDSTLTTFNFDSILSQLYEVSHMSQDVENGRVTGGNFNCRCTGDGIMDYAIIDSSLTLLMAFSAGHGHFFPMYDVEYLKRHFDKQGRITMQTNFVRLSTDDFEEYDDPIVAFRDFAAGEISNIAYASQQERDSLMDILDSLFQIQLAEGGYNDTIKYHYNKNGLLEYTYSVNDPTDFRYPYPLDSMDTSPERYTDIQNLSFYQCFVGREPMEDFIMQHIGFLPQLILIEIDFNDVVAYEYMPSLQKYKPE